MPKGVGYYLGPHLGSSIDDIAGLFGWVRQNPVEAARLAAENTTAGDVKASIESILESGRALGSGEYGRAGMNLGNALGAGMAAAVPLLGARALGIGPKLADDLPMDEASRMARAREMGFDTDVYHGSGADIQEFVPSESGLLGPGVYVADSPRGATKWAPDNVEHSPGGVTYPLKARGQFASMEQLNAARDAARAQGAKGKDSTLKAINALKAEGFIGISDNSGDVMTVFDPKNIRSRFAKFDPSKKDSANILAGVGGGVVAGGALAGMSDEEVDEMFSDVFGR